VAGLSLNDLMQAAGASLGDAQTKLTEGIAQPPTKMALSDATLELKVAVDGVQGGALRITPVSPDDARSGAINVGALSTVTMRFVAFSADAVPVPAPDTPRGPTGEKLLTEKEAIKAVADRTDIKAIARALGPFTFDALFVAAKTVWLVSVKGRSGEVVRDVAVPAKKG
jgi:hypothetical protein